MPIRPQPYTLKLTDRLGRWCAWVDRNRAPRKDYAVIYVLDVQPYEDIVDVVNTTGAKGLLHVRSYRLYRDWLGELPRCTNQRG